MLRTIAVLAAALALAGCGGNTTQTVIGPGGSDAGGSAGNPIDAPDDRSTPSPGPDAPGEAQAEVGAIDARIEAAPDATTCSGFTVTGQCTLCGRTGLNGPVCSAGGMCPLHAHCVGSNACACDAGYAAYACDGQICNNQCKTDTWWCRPTAVVTPTCDSAPVEAEGMCRCGDGREIALACGNDLSCAQRCDSCDIVAQDCPGSAQKCTVRWDPQSLAQVLCTDTNGTRTEGQICTISGAIGEDDCARGLYCSWTGLSTNGPRCRRLCHTNGDCSLGQGCIWWGGNVPSSGLCLDACTLAPEDAGAGDAGWRDDCPAGQWCDAAWSNERHGSFVLACRELGTLGGGGVCRAPMDCAAGLTCAYATSTSGYCEPQCSPGIADCPQGMTCRGLDGYPATGWGACGLASDGGS